VNMALKNGEHATKNTLPNPFFGGKRKMSFFCTCLLILAIITK
jgi:hypothetical protein